MQRTKQCAPMVPAIMAIAACGTDMATKPVLTGATDSSGAVLRGAQALPCYQRKGTLTLPQVRSGHLAAGCVTCAPSRDH
jgi:hypothetical protein